VCCGKGSFGGLRHYFRAKRPWDNVLGAALMREELCKRLNARQLWVTVAENVRLDCCLIPAQRVDPETGVSYHLLHEYHCADESITVLMGSWCCRRAWGWCCIVIRTPGTTSAPPTRPSPPTGWTCTRPSAATCSSTTTGDTAGAMVGTQRLILVPEACCASHVFDEAAVHVNVKLLTGWYQMMWCLSGSPSPLVNNQDAEALVKYMRSELGAGKVAVHGESIGGMVACHAAARCEGVDLLVADRTFATLAGVADRLMASWAGRAMHFFTGRGAEPGAEAVAEAGRVAEA
jgi:pimeloyl-ACP methyl ester carboxylesterase